MLKTHSIISAPAPFARKRSYRAIQPTSNSTVRRLLRPARAGNDAVDSWLDLVGFVAKSSSSSAHTPYDDLADAIGRDCYIDVAGWHLYLKDVKLPGGSGVTMAQGLAAQLGAQAQGQGRVSSSDVESMLGRVPVALGKGKATLPLGQLMPSMCVQDLSNIVEDYVKRL